MRRTMVPTNTRGKGEPPKVAFMSVPTVAAHNNYTEFGILCVKVGDTNAFLSPELTKELIADAQTALANWEQFQKEKPVTVPKGATKCVITHSDGYSFILYLQPSGLWSSSPEASYSGRPLSFFRNGDDTITFYKTETITVNTELEN